MTDEELIEYYAKRIPVDDELLEPLGVVMWAAIRLHHTVRDALGQDLGTGLSDQPFDRTLGQAVADLAGAAALQGEPWATELEDWRRLYGSPATQERNSISHSIGYSASDGKQSLRTTSRHRNQRITHKELRHAAGHLTLAAVRLGEALERCRKAP